MVSESMINEKQFFNEFLIVIVHLRCPKVIKGKGDWGFVSADINSFEVKALRWDKEISEQ